MNDKLVLAERIPRDAKDLMPLFKVRIHKLLSGLDVSTTLEVTSSGFVSAEVGGPDSEFSIELIKREMGLSPRNLSEVQVNDNFKAYVTGINKRRESLEVELGPASTNVKSEVTKEALIAQLCDGRDTPIERVTQPYCIQEGVPLLVRITSIDPQRRHIEAWISDDQIARFDQWRRERFHRIIAIGGSQDKLREAVNVSKVERDVIEIEELSFTANSLVCKLGTDAPGIIAKIGRYISNFKLYAFLPERVDRLRPELAGKRQRLAQDRSTAHSG